jgi:hypothetical protein
MDRAFEIEDPRLAGRLKRGGRETVMSTSHELRSWEYADAHGWIGVIDVCDLGGGRPSGGLRRLCASYVLLIPLGSHTNRPKV